MPAFWAQYLVGDYGQIEGVSYHIHSKSATPLQRPFTLPGKRTSRINPTEELGQPPLEKKRKAPVGKAARRLNWQQDEPYRLREKALVYEHGARELERCSILSARERRTERREREESARIRERRNTVMQRKRKRERASERVRASAREEERGRERKREEEIGRERKRERS